MKLLEETIKKNSELKKNAEKVKSLERSNSESIANAKMQKVLSEKKEFQEKFKILNDKYEKTKQLNTELTKEAIMLNEEKLEFKVN